MATSTGLTPEEEADMMGGSAAPPQSGSAAPAPKSVNGLPEDEWNDMMRPSAATAAPVGGARGAAPSTRKASQLDAIAAGVVDMIPFGRDIGTAGLAAESYLPKDWQSSADAGMIGDIKPGTPFSERFSQIKPRANQNLNETEAQHPVTSTVATIGSGIAALPVDAPMAVAGKGLEALGVGKGLINTALSSSAVGAGYGALYGAGEGDNIADRAQHAVDSAKFGAVAGGIGPLVGKAVEGAAGMIGDKIAPYLPKTATATATTNERTAWQKFVAAAGIDAKNTAPMSAEQLADAKAAGQPVNFMDSFNDGSANNGAYAMQRLAAEAANLSPEAGADINAAAQSRFQTLAARAKAFFQYITGDDLDAATTQDALKTQAQAANETNFKAAYEHPNAKGIFTPRIGEIMGTKPMQSAIAKASEIANNDARIKGIEPMPNPFELKSDGTYGLKVDPQGDVVQPPLKYWDYVQRALRAQSETLGRAGSATDAAQVEGIRGALNSELGKAVPEFTAARTGAFNHFQAEDAYTAGQNFLTNMTNNVKSSEMKQQLAELQGRSPAQADLFAKGMMAQIAQKGMSMSDRQNLLRMFSSPEMKDRMMQGLGQYAPKVQGWLRTEQAMDNMRAALGNSWTARAQGDMAGGHGFMGSIISNPVSLMGATALETYFVTRDWQSALANGFIAGMARHAIVKNAANQKAVGNALARIMLSNDIPSQVKTMQEMSNSRSFMDALKSLTPNNVSTRSSIAATNERSKDKNVTYQYNVTGRSAHAKGGSVGRKDHDFFLNRLIGLADKAKRDIKKETKPILKTDDNVVAKALAVAGRTIK
jgi:hypothetical protein